MSIKEDLEVLYMETRTQCYSAKRYPISRRHRQQMLRRSIRKNRQKKCVSQKFQPKIVQQAKETVVKSTECREERQYGGGYGSVIFRENVDTPVTIEYAVDILSQCVEGVFEEELISREAPIKPKGGDMFVIDTNFF